MSGRRACRWVRAGGASPRPAPGWRHAGSGGCDPPAPPPAQTGTPAAWHMADNSVMLGLTIRSPTSTAGTLGRNNDNERRTLTGTLLSRLALDTMIMWRDHEAPSWLTCFVDWFGDEDNRTQKPLWRGGGRVLYSTWACHLMETLKTRSLPSPSRVTSSSTASLPTQTLATVLISLLLLSHGQIVKLLLQLLSGHYPALVFVFASPNIKHSHHYY